MLGFDGISSFAVSTVKETGCISLYWGVIVFFSSLSFWGVGERGGMVLLHVNDPPFFTTPSENAKKLTCSDHFLKLRCWKIARRCGEKHISKSKC